MATTNKAIAYKYGVSVRALNPKQENPIDIFTRQCKTLDKAIEGKKELSMQIDRDYYLKHWTTSNERREKVFKYKSKGYEIIVDIIAVI